MNERWNNITTDTTDTVQECKSKNEKKDKITKDN